MLKKRIILDNAQKMKKTVIVSKRREKKHMATSKEYILNALEKNRAPLLHEPNKAYFVINGERKDLTSDLNAVKSICFI